MTFYYVRQSVGSDSNDGLSSGSAWKTLWHANESGSAGDTIYIGAGNYSVGSDITSWVYPQHNGSAGNYITYYGDRGGNHTGDAGNVIVAEINPRQYIQVIGIEATISAHGQLGAINCIIDQCKFPWCSLQEMGGSTVKNCIIERTSGGNNCIYASSPTGDLFIYYNTIIHDINNSDDIINIGAGFINVYIKNNIFYKKQGSGKFLRLNTYDYLTFCDNNCFHSESYAPNFGEWYGVILQTEPTFEEWQTDSPYDTNSVKADPEFIDPASNYHLQASSPCKNVGTDVGIYYDYDGVLRPQGSGYDIGAYEFIYHPPQQLITSDTNITGKNQQIIILDANILIENVQQIITSDVDIGAVVKQLILSDANITGTSQSIITSDAYIYFIIVQQLIISDANIVGIIQRTITSDANVSHIRQQLILSDAKIIPATSPDYFSFAKSISNVPNFSFKTQDDDKIFLFDAKLKHTCTHMLTSGIYRLNTCPRCLGKGYYYDIKFSSLGDVYTVKESEKLLQELVKITLTSKGQNIFHSKYGSYVSDSIGMVQTKNFREAKLKQSIMDAVLRLKYLQREGIDKGYRFSLKELIDKVTKIEMYEIGNDPTQLGFKVQIVTVDNTVAVLQGAIYL